MSAFFGFGENKLAMKNANCKTIVTLPFFSTSHSQSHILDSSHCSFIKLNFKELINNLKTENAVILQPPPRPYALSCSRLPREVTGPQIIALEKHMLDYQDSISASCSHHTLRYHIERTKQKQHWTHSAAGNVEHPRCVIRRLLPLHTQRRTLHVAGASQRGGYSVNRTNADWLGYTEGISKDK